MLLPSVGIYLLLTVTGILFFTGLFGVIFNRRNVLMAILSIEILLLAVNLNFAALSVYLDDIVGQIFVIFVLTIAAAESAIGLSVIATFFKLKNSIKVSPIKKNIKV